MNINLDKGEIICPECNGDSWIHELVKEKGIVYTRYCRYCKGEGKLDWIDNLTTKNKKYCRRDINSFIIKNLTPFETIQLGPNLKIKPNNYIHYYHLDCDDNSTNIFDLINMCKYMKERKLVVYEDPGITHIGLDSKYDKILQVIMYGKVIIKL